MKKLIWSLSVLSVLASPLAKAECQFTTSSEYYESRCKIPDLTDSEQREVVSDFIGQVRDISKAANLPKRGTKIADAALAKMQADVSPVVDAMNSKIVNDRRGREMGSADILPNGLFAVVGGNGSFGAVLSGGASAMVAIVACPVWVTRISKFTGEKTHFVRLDMAIGGLATLGIGVGAGGGGGFRYGIGAIWGDLPKAETVFESGFTLGFDGDAEAVQGFGLSIMAPKNKTTGLKNMIAFIHGDTGVAAKIEAHGTGFWFLTPAKMQKISHLDKIFGDDATPVENTPPSNNQGNPGPAITPVNPTPAGSPSPAFPSPPSN